MMVFDRSQPGPPSLCVLSCIVVLVVAAAASAVGPYTVTNLGTLGGAESTAYGLNDQGQVVGESDTTGGLNRAFLWLPAPAYGLPAGMNDLGTLGGSDSAAFDVNNVGQVVGRADTATPGVYHAYLWDPVTTLMQDLGAISGELGEARVVNDFGEIVGKTEFIDHTFFVAFYRDSFGGIMLLSNMVPGDYESDGFGIGYAGNLNFSGTTYFPARAYKFGGETGFIQLQDLGVESHAYGMNVINQVVGSVSSTTFEHAATWQFFSYTDLGTLGGTNSRANAINDQGLIVGWAETASQEKHAFVYDQGVMTDLNDVVANVSAWVLEEAIAINEPGQLVGSGTIGGAKHAFLLTPCEAGGDLNGDGLANGGDLQQFTTAVVAGSTDPSDVCDGDFNSNESVESGDISGMLAALLAL